MQINWYKNIYFKRKEKKKNSEWTMIPHGIVKVLYVHKRGLEKKCQDNYYYKHINQFF
jgi:hypothetical protein